MSSDRISQFLRRHHAAPVGQSPLLPGIELVEPNDLANDQANPEETKIDLDYECQLSDWVPKPVGEAPARPGEYPTRFVDGCHAGQPVLCLSVRDTGRPIPLYLAEVGAVVLESDGPHFKRSFVHLERVLSFIADPFEWNDVEMFATALQNNPALNLRVLPANDFDLNEKSLFDYEAAREQARSRAQYEMLNLERLAYHAVKDHATLIDGPLDRVDAGQGPNAPLTIGIVKMQSKQYLHAQGMRALLNLRPAHRTPGFLLTKTRGATGRTEPVVTWYVKLSTGREAAPNWGYVRVEITQRCFERQFRKDFSFIDRLSRWLIDARCRADSYARMPVSLEPIVRAEDSLKPLFTPIAVLVNRLYRQAGLFRGSER